jgi:hypothetical protein
MKKYLSHLVTLVSSLFVLAGCQKDDDLVPIKPPIYNAPELITSLIVTCTDSSNTSIIKVFKFRDPDGDGGNAPVQFDTIRLNANKTYNVTLEVLDETKNPPVNVTNEIWEERNDHQFFFNTSNISTQTTYMDKDGNNLPVGLTSKWRTQGTGSGRMRIILKHQVGIKNNSEAPGETDIDVNFVFNVQ